MAKKIAKSPTEAIVPNSTENIHTKQLKSCMCK